MSLSPEKHWVVNALTALGEQTPIASGSNVTDDVLDRLAVVLKNRLTFLDELLVQVAAFAVTCRVGSPSPKALR